MTPPNISGADTDVRQTAIAPVTERFGIDPAVFERFRFERISKKYVTVTAADHVLVAGLRYESTGIPFMRMNLRHPKLTTAATRLFGVHATRNVIHATTDEARSYARREDIALQSRHLESITGPGYVIVTWEGLPLGLGLLLIDAGNPRLKSLYPGRQSPSG